MLVENSPEIGTFMTAGKNNGLSISA